MNACSIGRGFPNNNVNNIAYNSSRTVLEFDVAFVDCHAALTQSANPNQINFRRSDFEEFLLRGNTVVIFLSSVGLDSVFIFKNLILKPVSGTRADFKGPDFLKTFWDSIRGDMEFCVELENPPGKPFLFIPTTTRPIGALEKHGNGNVLLLPSFVNHVNPVVGRQRDDRFHAAFEKLILHLSPPKPVVHLPNWSKDYGWQREQDLKQTFGTLQKQANELAAKIQTTAAEIEVEDKLKALITGKGDVLVDVVVDVLRELGLKANHGEPGRDDIIVKFEQKDAVIEVKGKKSSAAESDAAQLEKWVAGFKEEKGTDPKGILFVNAYCETPLSERKDPAFPHQMLKYSTQRDHCLITTTQLLGLLLQSRAHPEKCNSLIQSLFDTVGIYHQFSDWKDFLIVPTKTK